MRCDTTEGVGTGLWQTFYLLGFLVELDQTAKPPGWYLDVPSYRSDLAGERLVLFCPHKEDQLHIKPNSKCQQIEEKHKVTG
ncbi:hypothetical protein DPEC_G00343180 [Dallia pectoralis]|uniref:Uncharacterized protein n=1 Tax=Dallia pectoralis TaxID=75939 RepID=A0ACC2F2T8_DALPE|nr:hypothetical protein DPEC_G00343180 [Dallia pectoralis]